jgi:hypothetical protein
MESTKTTLDLRFFDPLCADENGKENEKSVAHMDHAKNAEKARNETDPIIKSGEVQVYTLQGALPARDNKLR